MNSNLAVLSSQDLLDRAYEDYCTNQSSDRGIPQDEFLDRYPTIRSSLARLLLIHSAARVQFGREKPKEWPALGSEFRGFTLLAKLGDGAFSRVYLASEDDLGHRRVALKLTWQSIAEAFTQGRLNHPNVMPVHSAVRDRETGLSVICMPYLGSSTLGTLLDARMSVAGAPRDSTLLYEAARDRAAPFAAVPKTLARQPFQRTVRQIFADISAALAFLHENNVVHQDLKPTNILLTPDAVPVVLDFNLADDPQNPERRFGGTCLYMPPEQIERMEAGFSGERVQPDPRTDVFALGVILFQVLTGRHPFGPIPADFTPSELRQLLKSRFQNGFSFTYQECAALPRDLRDLVERCLKLDPRERPTALECRDRLRPRTPFLASRWLAAGIVGLALTTALSANLWRMQTPAETVLSARELSAVYEDGVAAYQQKDTARAEALFARVVQHSPEDYRGWLARSLCLVDAAGVDADDDATFASALRDAQTAYRLRPDPVLAEWVGYIAARDNQHVLAESMYRAALRSGCETESCFNNLAALLVRSNRWKEALPFAEKALAIHPDSAPALGNRCLYYLRACERSLKQPVSEAESRRVFDFAYADCLKLAQSSNSPSIWQRSLARLKLLRSQQDPSREADTVRAVEEVLAAGASDKLFFDLDEWRSFFERHPDLRSRVDSAQSSQLAKFPYLVRPAVQMPALD